MAPILETAVNDVILLLGDWNMIARIRSMLRRSLRAGVRFAWGDWTEYGSVIHVLRDSDCPEYVGILATGLVDAVIFLPPSEARRVADLLYTAAYEAAELIPVPEQAAACK